MSAYGWAMEIVTVLPAPALTALTGVQKPALMPPFRPTVRAAAAAAALQGAPPWKVRPFLILNVIFLPSLLSFQLSASIGTNFPSTSWVTTVSWTHGKSEASHHVVLTGSRRETSRS